MTAKLDEMWQALEAHEPKPAYAEAWATMCRERTYEAARAAYWAAPEESAARAAAEAVWDALTVHKAFNNAAYAARITAKVDLYAQRAIDAIKGVKP